MTKIVIPDHMFRSSGKPVRMEVTKLHPRAKLPVYATAGAAGADLHAVMHDKTTHIDLVCGAWCLVQTGLAFAIPAGYEVQIRPRSGIAFRYAVTVLNSPGTIDSDYRGEIGVIMINHGSMNFRINEGDRIAQMVLTPVVQALFHEVGELSETTRGAGGFGSTGTRA